LLASLEERFPCGELDYFLEAGNGDCLEEDDLVDEIAKDRFALFWKIAALSAEEALLCF